MITAADSIDTAKRKVGSKAVQLLRLLSEGFSVPPLVALTCAEVKDILESNTVAESMVDDIVAAVPVDQYAVRSAVLVEDGQDSAQAGAFTSILRVEAAELEKAIVIVAKDAAEKLSDTSSIAIIIQEYIEADLGGVLFTRHPAGEYRRVVEHQVGSAEQVVHGGAVIRTECPVSGELKSTQPYFMSELLQVGNQIESLYEWPQDIEWVIKNKQLYIVQTRPITSLTKAQYEGQVYVDAFVPKENEYFYEQAPAAETFVNPSPLSFSVLESLHKSTGPIAQAYQTFGVQYHPTNEHIQIGNAVYVDKLKELQSLFPAYRYRQGKRILGWGNPRSLFLTWRNTWHLGHLQVHKRIDALQTKIRHFLAEPVQTDLSVQAAIEQLQVAYKTVFEISLCAQKASNDLERFLGESGRQFSSALLWATNELQLDMVDMSGVVGNSVNIDDTSEFVPITISEKENVDAADWLKSLPSWKQHALQPKITTARQYLELREASRYVSVRVISQLRNAIQNMVNDSAVDHSLSGYTTLDELIRGELSESKLQQRQIEYKKLNNYRFPYTIASHVPEAKATASHGVSAGVVVGKATSIKNLKQNQTEKSILLVDTLSPDVVQHFPFVLGVIARTGGLLSHAAIMAREARLPVVVNETYEIAEGQQVRIDGATGEITPC